MAGIKTPLKGVSKSGRSKGVVALRGTLLMLDKTLKISFIMIFFIKVNHCDLWGISEYTYFKYCCRSCSIGKSRVSSEVSEKLQEGQRGR